MIYYKKLNAKPLYPQKLLGYIQKVAFQAVWGKVSNTSMELDSNYSEHDISRAG